MRLWHSLRTKLRSLLHGNRADRELDEELRLHLQNEIEQRIANGMSKEEASRKAQVGFGGLEQLKEECREARSIGFVHDAIRDFRYALRGWTRTPGFVIVVTLTLAIGIGANTAVFTFLDTVVLRSVPVERSDELVVFGRSTRRGISAVDDPVDRSNRIFSHSLYQELRDRNDAFQSLAAIDSVDWTAYVRRPDAPSGSLAEGAVTRLVSGNYFQTLGVGVLHGRTIQPSDDQLPAAHPVAVLSYEYWKRAFNSDAEIVGDTVLLNSRAFQVVGIAEENFRGETIGRSPDLFVPLSMHEEVSRQDSFLTDHQTTFLLLIGRLKDGVNLRQAEIALTAQFQAALRGEAGTQLSPQREQRLSERRIELAPGQEGLSSLRQSYQGTLYILMAVVSLVLLIACANTANLLLVRGTARQREIDARLALGASRRRLVRQLFTESLLLSSLGATIGLALASWGTQFIAGLFFGTIRVVPIDIDPDLRVLTFTCAVSLLTAMLFGLIPAVRTTRGSLALNVRTTDSALGKRILRLNLSKLLVIGQVALALILLVGAGLFIGSLQNLRTIDLGFRPENVLVFQLDPRGGGYSDPNELTALYRRILDSVRALSGVENVSLSARTLLESGTVSESVEVDGYMFAPGEDNGVRIHHVSPGYFETVGMPLVSGRVIEERDREDSPLVAVVNEKFEQRFFPGSSAIGGRIGFGFGRDDIEIVGIARNAKYSELRQETPEMVFLSTYQTPVLLQSLEILSDRNSQTLIEEVRQVFSEIDRDLPITAVTTLNGQIDDALRRERLLTSLTSFFGLLALLLSSIGLFGVMSYIVSRQTNEIGIRMAVGAKRGLVLRTVLTEALSLVALGLILGTGASVASTRWLAGLLYGMSPRDPWTVAAAAGVLLGVAALAALLPALQAARTDPMVALRHE